MNVFILDTNPVLAARWQHDRHVVKMILESCQILSTAIQSNDMLRLTYDARVAKFGDTIDSSLYRPTHENHPATQWAHSPTAFGWLTVHLTGLLREYNRRFGKSHKCSRLQYVFAAMTADFAGAGFHSKEVHHIFDEKISQGVYDFVTRISDFTYCGPDSYAVGTARDRFPNMLDIVESYRAYYLAEKVAGNRWTHHPKLDLPDWLAPSATIHHRTPTAPKRKTVHAPIKPTPGTFKPAPNFANLTR